MEMTAERVASADGTTISFLSAGTGPGVIVLPGNNRRARHYASLAVALSGGYSVHVLDRRGRGDSGPQGPGYSVETEVDDVLAVLAATGADAVFGHSYGGLVGLHLALRRPVRSLVLYEPGVNLRGRFDISFVPEFAERVAAGQRVRPLALMLKRLGLLPFGAAPESAYRAFVAALLRSGRDGDELRAMMPATVGEATEFARLTSDGSRYRAIGSPTTVLVGERSMPPQFRAVAEELAGIIPGARYEPIPGVGHNGPDLEAPDVVAERVAAALAR